jgi:hypothetical protein
VQRVGTIRAIAIGIGGAIVGALLAVAAIPVAGQSSASAPYRAPRAADGHPDLNGIWQAIGEAHFDLEAHVARPALALRAGPFGPVPAAPVLPLGAVVSVPPGVGVVDGGGAIPYKPDALATRNENREHWIERDPEIKCYLPGVPRATYMPYPFQILQSNSALFIAYEYAGATRNILMKDPGPPPVSSWMGQSVGRWDGDTLVVDVTGMNDSTWFDRAGNFHSEAVHVVERYTRTAPDVISYQATIEDGNVFTKPWTIKMPLYRRLDANVQLLDFKCVEFVEEMLYGKWRKNPLK